MGLNYNNDFEEKMVCVISVIIPFYCTPKHLFDKCLNSILGVQSNEIEIIVVDDGSPEEFFSILDKYSNNPQVKIIHTQNAGVSAARNRGIKESTGKWILFVDSDDYVNTEAFNKILTYARKNNGDVVLFSGARDKEGRISYNTTFLKQNINYAADMENRIRIMESALSVGQIPGGYRQYFSLGSPCCKLIRTDFLRVHNLKFDTSLKFAEDTLFSLQVYQKSKDIRFVNLFLYYYVCYSESTTRRFRPGLTADMDIFFGCIWAFIRDNNLEIYLEKAYYTRAQFEVSRSATLEFFHPNNTDKTAKMSFRAFKNKEPYCTALKNDYWEVQGIKGKIKKYLTIHGYIRLYRVLLNITKSVKNICNL